jgi:dihydrofolate reductase
VTVTLVAAAARNGVIGREGGLPWRLSSDLKRFRAETTGKVVVMGRRTFEAIGRPLPDRHNIVVTRRRDFRADGVEPAFSLADALTLAKVRGRCMAHPGEVCVIGGAQIYEQAMPLADRLVITHVEADVKGDARFPLIRPDEWQIVEATDWPSGPKDDHPTRHVIYRRRSPSGT